MLSLEDISPSNMKEFLEESYHKYNQVDFVEDDPIQIPHSYSKLQDIEITAFWTSMLAWGQRKTIINKSKALFERMDNAPHDFLLNYKEKDLKKFEDFKHRTFQPIDCLYFIEFLSHFYKKNESMETAFTNGINETDDDTTGGLIHFHNTFFSLDFAPKRTKKHVATPARKSSCKRLNMFLRWMVRKDGNGVDFGLWDKIPTSKLLIPLDVHVRRVAEKLNLLRRDKNDIKAVQELTAKLREFDANDPVKYDFALFGLGVNEKF